MNKQNFDTLENISPDYLEGISETTPFINQPATAAGSASVSSNTAIDTSVLETVEPVVQLAEIKQYIPQSPVEEEVDEEENIAGRDDFIKEADVRLDDIIKKFFSNSERPVVIVSDDKIEYANETMQKILEAGENEIVGQNFFSFVAEKDWNRLAENIGVMLTDGKKVNADLKSKNGKLYNVGLEAIYLPDARRFSFILIGQDRFEAGAGIQERSAEKPAVLNLYDEVTGLPSFYLFEDRVQMAINYENYKDSRLRKNMVAVIAVSIDNIFVLRQQGIADFVLKKLASKLVLSLKKNYTVARGMAYEFWIMMNDISSMGDLDLEMRKLNAIFMEGVSDNITEHNVNTSIGVSIFPTVAKSAKKLLEQTIKATKKSQEKGGGISVFSEEDEPPATVN
ncbi:MAG: PAS domain-containing protein [Alphaproteobacteria bacterium]|nr:PAS domain-containing protein [Alphaproteobacteria bacterium]